MNQLTTMILTHKSIYNTQELVVWSEYYDIIQMNGFGNLYEQFD
jgi:hypothetical protein